LFGLVWFWPSSEVITAAEAAETAREAVAARTEAKTAEKAIENAAEAEGVAKAEVKKPDQVANPDEVAKATKVLDHGHRIKIGGLGRMANSAFGGKLNLCGTCSHLCTMFVVYLVIDNKYNVYVR